MNKKSIGISLVLLVALILGGIAHKKQKMIQLGWMKYSADVNPSLRAFEDPTRTTWTPVGPRQIPVLSDVIPRRNIWRARHGGPLNSDEVTTIISPEFELDWISETRYFNPSSASFDSQGDLYSTPQFPADRVLMEKLDGKTGELLWTIKGTKAFTGGGRPLVLSDPDNPGNEIIYVGIKAEVLATHPNGEVIYQLPTGFSEPPSTATFKNLGEYNSTGPNYNPVIDGLVWATGTGLIYAVDRKTGKRNIEPFQLPGSPSPGKDNRKLPPALKKLEKEELSYQFEGTPDGYTLAHQLAVVLGENVVNSNFISIDQTTGAIWITATDLDENDGKKDGISEAGALIRLDVVPNPEGVHDWKFEIGAKLTFEGGSASTPAIRADGQRGYVGDAFGNMIAFDYDCNLVWKFALGKEGSTVDQIGGSIAVSSDNGELYAITRSDVVKIVDKGGSAELIWRATLDMYADIDSSFHQRNLNTATITPNGIAFLAGVGPALNLLGDTPAFLPVKVGVGLIDKQTGKLRWFADGKDIGQSSMGMVMPTPDGGIVISHSPLRRALARGLFGDRIYPTDGGMTKYGPRRIDLMLRDIAVAAADKIRRSISIHDKQLEGVMADIAEIEDLISQARLVAPRGIKSGDISDDDWKSIETKLKTVEAKHAQWRSSNNIALLVETASKMEEIVKQLSGK